MIGVGDDDCHDRTKFLKQSEGGFGKRDRIDNKSSLSRDEGAGKQVRFDLRIVDLPDVDVRGDLLEFFGRGHSGRSFAYSPGGHKVGAVASELLYGV